MRWIYGYMRVVIDEPDEKTRHTEQSLRGFADTAGLYLAGLFEELEPRSMARFYDLVTELRRTGATDVVIPAWEHLSTHRLIRECMIATLQLAGAQNIVALDSDEVISVTAAQCMAIRPDVNLTSRRFS
jgi:hypothetical protein